MYLEPLNLNYFMLFGPTWATPLLLGFEASYVALDFVLEYESAIMS